MCARLCGVVLTFTGITEAIATLNYYHFTTGEDGTVNTKFSPSTNYPPVLIFPNDKTVKIGEDLEFTLSASDPGDILTYSYSPTLPGATLNPSSGEFSWIPSAGDVGEHSVTFTVTDDGNPPLSDSVNVKITVISPSTNQAPNQPKNIFPNNGAIIKTEPITLMASVFTDPDIGDIHATSQWQITTKSGEYSTCLTFDSGYDTTNLVKITIPSGYLTGTQYYWRVRYQDNIGDWSDWSTETSFTIQSNQPPVASFTISVESPKAGQEIMLDASSSQDTDGGKIVVYEWDFNGDLQSDGSTTSPKIFYFWDESGSYSVNLKVFDNDGASDTYVKNIIIQPNSFWQKTKNFFAPSVYRLNEKERQQFDLIKSELKIFNYPHSANPSDDPDLYWYDDDELLTVLYKPIDPNNAPGFTYKLDIISAIEEEQLMEEVFRNPTPSYSYMIKPLINYVFGGIWKTGADISKEGVLQLVAGNPYISLGLNGAFFALDVISIRDAFNSVKDTAYGVALQTYFREYWDTNNPNSAWDSASQILEYNIGSVDNEKKAELFDATRQYFEGLWKDYGQYYGANGNGLPLELREKNRQDLRALFLSGLESYKFEHHKIVYVLHSPGEISVSDSKGQITGSVSGIIKEEIPKSVYDEETKSIIIFDATDTYLYRVVGTGEGTYGQEIISVHDGKKTSFMSTNIPIFPNVIHEYAVNWAVLSQGGNGVTLQIDSNGDGTFEQTFTTGSELTHDEYIQKTDATPPQTTISTAGTIGTNSWFVSDVTITLAATDNPDGSGVASTEYSFDGSTWTPYTAPFIINAEGTTTVSYRSTDKGGNVETLKQQVITIDKIPPLIAISSPLNGAEYMLNTNLLATYTAVDSGSGLESVTGPIPKGGSIPTNTAGKQTFTVTAKDNAGNEATKTVTYNIVVPAKVKIVPRTINLASKGFFITFAKSPDDYKVTDIDAKSVTCEGATAVRVIRLKIFPHIFVAVFKVSDLQNVPVRDKVTLTLKGDINQNAKIVRFKGSDTISVINKNIIIKDEIADVSKLTDQKIFEIYGKDFT